MKKLHTYIGMYICMSLQLILGQEMIPKEYNSTSFYTYTPLISDELKSITPVEFQDHPEFGILPYAAPCIDCYELLHERTESTRMFIKNKTGGKEFYSQATAGKFSYQDELQRWMTIDPRLRQQSAGIYQSTQQARAVELNTNGKYSSFHLDDQQFKFNNNLRLELVTTTNTLIDMGQADWSNAQIGEEGIYITNGWPGIDIHITYRLNEVKLNYLIPAPLDYLHNITYLHFLDHLDFPSSLKLVQENGIQDINDFIGRLQLTDNTSAPYFTISKAIGYDKSENKEREQPFSYTFRSNILYLNVPQSFITDVANQFPLIIDPLVTSTATQNTGWMSFRFNGTCFNTSNSYCQYTLNVPRPANSTIVGASFSLAYESLSGYCWSSCWMSEAGYKITGPCGINPTGSTYWSCPTGNSPGTCTATNFNIDELVTGCLTQQCSGTIPFNVQTHYCYCNVGGNCGDNCQYIPNNNWSVTVRGRTLEVPAPIALSPNPCLGTVTLAAQPSFGVPGYTYLWNGGQTTPTISVTSSGNYSVVVRDNCNQVQTQQFSIICPLGVSLTDYYVQQITAGNKIIWKTKNETNNDHFKLMHRTDEGDKWTELTTISSQGNGNADQMYSYTHNRPANGTNYYQLIQVNYDGTEEYFGVKSINNTSSSFIKVYPQPATDQLIVEYKGFVGSIAVYNLLGSTIQLDIEKEGDLSKIKIEHLPHGVYLLDLTNELGEKETIRFTKK